MDAPLIFASLCLALVCAFEFINGFHDTANAVAPVIYSNSLSAKKAVLLAAFFNFLGVVVGGTGVAIGIMKLLPLDKIAASSMSFGICAVLSLLIAAIIWNFGTWYLGIPASSSHTLIGSILGVGLVMKFSDNSVLLPWHKVIETLESLLVSPFVGFVLAFGAMHILHLYVTNKDFFKHPGRFWNKYPKTWIKSTLITSSAFVSFAHGSNDGQKGVGLAMLILIAFFPADYNIAGIISGTEQIPYWVIIMISISLGLGTMVGWKRIVITIGEKIGKDKLTYAQATVASLMTAITIESASHLHLPVSTTHILSSGVAGTMAHEHGKGGLQGDTIKAILMAWVLTLPVSTVLAGTIFFVLKTLFV
ncbi:MAG: inorganic phosphate transporter [Candidatus Altimarinota bacterium]